VKRIRLNISVFVLILTLVSFPSQGVVSGVAGPISGSEPVNSTMFDAFSEAELDELLAPIALYPDPLLAQLLPASTFVDQIAEAQKTLNGKSDDNLIANQSWDISVKSIAHYPTVLQAMSQKSDWTTALGQAYVGQAADVEKAIQRLRAQAKDAGTLVSNDKVLVETKTQSGQQVIAVEPAQPEVIYVPQYDPQVVYVQQGPSTGSVVAASMLSFGVGMAMGAWLNRGWNWYGGGVYYHGWSGGGWIGRSANVASINVNRNVYVNNSYRNINVDRNVTNRNISSYRTNLQRDATTAGLTRALVMSSQAPATMQRALRIQGRSITLAAATQKPPPVKAAQQAAPVKAVRQTATVKATLQRGSKLLNQKPKPQRVRQEAKRPPRAEVVGSKRL
jgi:Protein of unknown function (DUF3300)